MNLIEHLIRQLTFSGETFGPGARLAAVTDHIHKELIELGGPADELEIAVMTLDYRRAQQIAVKRALARGTVQKPGDSKEWVDVVLLAMDGLWRSIDEEANGNLTAQEIAEIAVELIEAKQTKNEGRDWPDWRTAPPGKAIEHDRSGEGFDAFQKHGGGFGQ